MGLDDAIVRTDRSSKHIIMHDKQIHQVAQQITSNAKT